METLDYMVKKFEIDLSKPSPIMIPIGRFKDIPRLFRELKFKKGAEIGIYRGSYSKILLRAIPGLHLTGVDLWDIYPGYKDFGKTDIKDAETEAREVVAPYNCTIIKDWSDKAADQIEDGSLDFVFIDGNHNYEWCVWDIAKWSKKVRKGGIIYGHDYDDYSTHRRWKEMQVVPAVNGWMEAKKISPWFVITNNKNKCWLYVQQD
jgi:hypothetical protein